MIDLLVSGVDENDENASEGEDVKNVVNALVNKVGSDDEIIKAEAIHLAGLPQTAGAPDGFGDLATVANSLINKRILRESALRVAYFGSSSANYGTSYTDCGTFDVPFPATGTTSIALSTLERTAMPSYYPVNVVANGGISGANTADMINRDTSTASATRKAISDVLAKDPDVIFARCGTINDLTSVTSATVVAQVATTLANHRLILARLSSTGVVVVDIGISGFDNGSAGSAVDLAATRQALVQLNAQYKIDAAESGGRVIFIDPVGMLSDETGAFLPDMTTDGRHLSIKGAKILTDAEYAAISPIFGVSVHRFNGDNVFPNPVFALTGSVASGTAATGVVPAATNGSLSDSAVIFQDGKIWQATTVTASTIGSVSLTINTNLAGMGVTAGDAIGIEFDYFIERPDGLNLSEIGPILVRLDMTNAAGGRLLVSAATSSQQPPRVPKISARATFPRVVIPDDPATIPTQKILIQVETRFAGQILRIGMTPPRIVINPI